MKEVLQHLVMICIFGGIGVILLLIAIGVIDGVWHSNNMIIAEDQPDICSSKHCYIVVNGNKGNCTVFEDSNKYNVGEIHMVYYQGSSPVYSRCTFNDKVTHDFYFTFGIILIMGTSVCCISCISECVSTIYRICNCSAGSNTGYGEGEGEGSYGEGEDEDSYRIGYRNRDDCLLVILIK